MPELLVYDEDYFNDTGELSDAWDAVGQIGVAFVGTLPALSGGGSAGGPARGLAAINAVGQQAIQSLQQLLSMVNSGQAPASAALPEAQRIAAALSNPQYVYQAKHGSDAAALNNFKSQAADIVKQIQSRGSATAATGITPTSSSGNAAAARSSASPLLLLAIIGGLGLLVFRR